MTTNAYIDGFNFYYGAVQGTPFKWLNLDTLVRQLLRGHSINKVKYFTARVDDRDGDPTQSQRQDTYHRALSSLPTVEIFYGQFRTNTMRLRLAKPRPNGDEFEYVLKTEEKGTDVALGAHLVRDAVLGEISCALVISNDSDLQVPVDMAVDAGVDVIVVNPHRHNRQDDHLRGSDRRNLRVRHLELSLFPEQVFLNDGRTVKRPPRWDP
jgi:uncharacterized LabA/DUF88 family protein